MPRPPLGAEYIDTARFTDSPAIGLFMIPESARVHPFALPLLAFRHPVFHDPYRLWRVNSRREGEGA